MSVRPYYPQLDPKMDSQLDWLAGQDRATREAWATKIGEAVFGRLSAPSVPVETSEAAAASLTPLKLGSLRYKVLLFIISRGAEGATTDEIEASLEGRHQTISPRVNELDLTYGYIQRCDGKEGRPLVKRPTRSGRQAFGYTATDLGKRVAKNA